MISRRPAVQSKTIDQLVGERLLAIMTESGMPKAILAQRLGLQAETIDEFCAGTRRIGAILLIEISRLLGVEVTYFYTDVTESEKQH